MEYNRDLASQRILVVNDDSINAAGLKVLERIANVLSQDVWVVAPHYEQSGKGYGVSFDTSLRVYQHSKRKFSVAGTPVDNVLVAVQNLMKDRKPDLVLSGINHGDNACGYRFISGTFNAALSAAHLSLRSIALSQCCSSPEDIRFTLAEHFLPGILRKLIVSDEWDADHVLSINFPEASVGEVAGVSIVDPYDYKVNWSVSDVQHPAGGGNYAWITAHHNTDVMSEQGEWKTLQDKKMITVAPVLVNHSCDSAVQESLKDVFAKNV